MKTYTSREKPQPYKVLSQTEDMTFEAQWKATDLRVFWLKNWTSEMLFMIDPPSREVQLEIREEHC